MTAKTLASAATIEQVEAAIGLLLETLDLDDLHRASLTAGCVETLARAMTTLAATPYNAADFYGQATAAANAIQSVGDQE